MTEQSALSPNIAEPNSPLDALVSKALRRYGDFAPETAEGAVMLMFIDFANDIIDELRQHPYWPADTALNYYTSQTETRPIPDAIMVAGLQAKYAEQQESAKLRTAAARYYRIMNNVLWNRLNGNTALALETHDKDNELDA